MPPTYFFSVSSVFLTFVSLTQCPYAHWDLCAAICVCLSPHLLPLRLTVFLSLSLSPWPVWSVIEGAVFTWPTGIEGTLCALWRQIALLAPSSLYLTFTFPPPLFILCPSSHYFISQPSLSPPSSPFPPHSYCHTQIFNFPLQSGNRYKQYFSNDLFECMGALLVTLEIGIGQKAEYKPLTSSAKTFFHYNDVPCESSLLCGFWN